MALDLTDFPEFQLLQRICSELQDQVRELRAGQQQWVHTDEARRITGYSRVTLWRLRQQPGSLIEWKSQGGIRYLRDSLHAHNRSRTIPRI